MRREKRLSRGESLWGKERFLNIEENYWVTSDVWSSHRVSSTVLVLHWSTVSSFDSPLTSCSFLERISTVRVLVIVDDAAVPIASDGNCSIFLILHVLRLEETKGWLSFFHRWLDLQTKRFSVVEYSSFTSATWSKINPSTRKSSKHLETSLSPEIEQSLCHWTYEQHRSHSLASSPQINKSLPLSFTCLTKSLSERISNAGAASPERCSATMKHRPISIDQVRISKYWGQSPLSPWVRKRTGKEDCFRRSIEAQSGSNVDRTITRLPARREE